MQTSLNNQRNFSEKLYLLTFPYGISEENLKTRFRTERESCKLKEYPTRAREYALPN